MLLAIDTSCDETALTVLDIGKVLRGEALSGELIRSEIISSQVKLHQPYGGVVPELASREHLKNLPILFKNCLSQAGIKKEDISAVAVTRGPGLNGCLLVGLCFAKAFAAVRRVPLLALNHMEGHIFAVELTGKQIQYPALALVVSGGHTMLVSMQGFRQYKILAKTRDDAAGEAFDKAANLLGLGYPGGAALSKLAERGNSQAYKLPIGLSTDPTAFSFSGLKTAVSRLISSVGANYYSPNDMCASIQHAIVKALVDKTVSAISTFANVSAVASAKVEASADASAHHTQPKTLILAGGVASNQYLRDWLSKEATTRNINFLVPPQKWCTDNASMIAALAARVIIENKEKFLNWQSSGISEEGKVGVEIGIDTRSDISALSRWSLAEL